MTNTDTQSVYSVFMEAVGHWPERPLFNVLVETSEIYGISPGEILYAEAQNEVERLASRLADAGYERGHRVMLSLENRPEFFLWWLALNKLGISVVPINPDLRALSAMLNRFWQLQFLHVVNTCAGRSKRRVFLLM